MTGEREENYVVLVKILTKIAPELDEFVFVLYAKFNLGQTGETN